MLIETKIAIALGLLILVGLAHQGLFKALRGPKRNTYKSERPWADPRDTQTYFNNANRRG